MTGRRNYAHTQDQPTIIWLCNRLCKSDRQASIVWKMTGLIASFLLWLFNTNHGHASHNRKWCKVWCVGSSCLFDQLMIVRRASETDFRSPSNKQSLPIRQIELTHLYWIECRKDRNTSTHWPAVIGSHCYRK